jgi:hypothetical protein
MIVRSYTRRKPFEAKKAEMTARLLSEVEQAVDRKIKAAFRTFPLNVWRAGGKTRLKVESR